jgi:hypothetical protein
MGELKDWGMQDPGWVPDQASDGAPYEVIDVGAGFDTDGDGRPDTALTVDGIDLVVAIDLDGDRFADQVLRIGPDAVVREVGYAPPVADGLLGQGEAGDQ